MKKNIYNSIDLFLLIINLKIIIKKSLRISNLFKVLIFGIYKLTKIIIISYKKVSIVISSTQY